MANFVELSIRSRERTELIKLDGQVREFIAESGVKEGVLHIHGPHTTDRAAPTFLLSLCERAHAPFR